MDRVSTYEPDVAAGIVIVLVILIVGTFSTWQKRDRFALGQTRGVRSAVDGLHYRVHLVHADSTRAADTMAEMNRRAIELMRYLRAKYLRGGRNGQRARATRQLLQLYNPDNLAENSPRDPEGDTSYTIDKGAVLALCLREKDQGAHDFHDLDTLTFVMLHELTHIAIEDQDHPKRFWQAFKFILEDAQDAGVLAPTNYGRFPEEYCGIKIDYNPLYDRGLQALPD